MKWLVLENDFHSIIFTPRTHPLTLSLSLLFYASQMGILLNIYFVFWFSFHSFAIFSLSLSLGLSKCIHHSTSLFHNKITSKCSLERESTHTAESGDSGRKEKRKFSFSMALVAISEHFSLTCRKFDGIFYLKVSKICLHENSKNSRWNLSKLITTSNHRAWKANFFISYLCSFSSSSSSSTSQKKKQNSQSA